MPLSSRQSAVKFSIRLHTNDNLTADWRELSGIENEIHDDLLDSSHISANWQRDFRKIGLEGLPLFCQHYAQAIKAFPDESDQVGILLLELNLSTSDSADVH